jgi:7-carboxy-7-deazaguanine synthase
MLKVVEIFESIQGEGKHAGEITTFVRLSGCNLKCSWCDTKYSNSNEEYIEYTPNELIQFLENNTDSPLYVFTGGEPMIQPHEDLKQVFRIIDKSFKSICVETNGTILPDPELFKMVDMWSISPKLLSSGNPSMTPAKMKGWFDLNKMHSKSALQFKFVIQDKKDVEELSKLVAPFKTFELYTSSWVLQPEGSKVEEIFEELPVWVEEYMPVLRGNFRYIPQVHKLIGFR